MAKQKAAGPTLSVPKEFMKGLIFACSLAAASIGTSFAQWEVAPDTSTPAALEEVFKKYESMQGAKPETPPVQPISVLSANPALSISPDIPLPQTELGWDTDTILLEKFNDSTSGEAFGGIGYIDSIPNLNKAISLSQGSWIRYTPAGLAPLENAGSVEFFIAPTSYNKELLTLQWHLTNTRPSWGYVLWVVLSTDGKIGYGAWNWDGVFGLMGTTAIPLNTWTHVGLTWDNTGSKIYINGKVDASTPQKTWPASPKYAYLGYWGFNDSIFLDEFRISKVARVRELGKKYKIEITLNPDKVVPGSNTQVIAEIKDTAGNPVAGKEIGLAAESVENSGGHNHNTTRPVGTFTQAGCTTDFSGRCTIGYRASLFGGEETIKAHLKEDPGILMVKELEVRVYDQETIPPAPLRVLPDGLYIKDGGTCLHHGAGASPGCETPDNNHYGTYKTVSNLQTIALAMSLQGLPRLEVNDISLPYGGGFDVNGNWEQDLGARHQGHRKGNQVDIQVNPNTPPAKLSKRKRNRLSDILIENGNPRIWPELDHWHLTF